MGTFTAEEVREAYGRISPYLDRTPLAEALYLKAEGRKYFYKLECLQPVRSFKIRGALNIMLTLTEG